MYIERVVFFKSAHLPSMQTHPFVFEIHPSASRLFDDDDARMHTVDNVKSLALPPISHMY